MEIVEIDNSILVSNEKELSSALLELDYSRFNNPENISLWLDDGWLNIRLNGPSDILDEFEEILKKIASFVEEEENFPAHISNNYSEYDILYVFKENTLYKYKEMYCYPDYGFYPLRSDIIINGIKSNKELEEKINTALTKDNNNIDYKRKFNALVDLVDKKYVSYKGENEHIPFDILNEIATEAYKLELETNYYGVEEK